MGKIMQHGTLHTSIDYAKLIEAQAMESSFLNTPGDDVYAKQKVRVLTKRWSSSNRNHAKRKSKY